MEIPRNFIQGTLHSTVVTEACFPCEASVEGNICNEVCNDSIDDDDHEALLQVENNDEGNAS